MSKTRKAYRLSDDAISVISDVMKQRSISSETAALEYILKDYSERRTLAEEVVEVFNETNKAWMERVKWAAQTAEQNSQDLYVAVNTILEHKEYKYYIDPELLTNDVLKGSERKRSRISSRQKMKGKEKVCKMQELKIRRIEGHILARLKTEADRKGIGLETLARSILSDYAMHPEIRKIEDRYEKLARDMAGLYRSIAEEMDESIIENTRMLERVNETLRKMRVYE